MEAGDLIILALDASGPVMSAAVMKDERILAEVYQDTGLNHSATLMPAVEEALRASGCGKGSLDLIACVLGPGSFTGVRIGALTAKGLARGLGIKIVGLDSLEVLAASSAYPGALIAPILDARRDQVYAALFRTGADMYPERLMDDAALSIDSFTDLLPRDERVLFVGDGVNKYSDRIKANLGGNALFAPIHIRQLTAGAALTLALRKADQALEPRDILPIYARAPQAERERKKKLEGNAIYA